MSAYVHGYSGGAQTRLVLASARRATR